MSDQFYSYETRQGTRPISWQDFVGVTKGLALAAARFDPEIILGIARGGLYAGTLLSHLLQKEFYSIRLTRRLNDRVVYDSPRWLVRPPPEVKDSRVLIVDEICSQGVTLRMAKEEVASLQAQDIRTAVMYTHTWGQHIPDYIGIVSDELILNPWDREILQDGEFVLHPEYAHALSQQGLRADASLLIGVEPYPLAKGE